MPAADRPRKRWNPLLREWVLVAPRRFRRPNLPGSCPFCPGGPDVPESYDVLSVPNRFPSLIPQGGGGRSAARGACEVVLYTPDHRGSLGELPAERIARVVALWRERSAALSALPSVKYVFVFENRGRENGVTLDHPHGQIYALPFVPPVLQTEAAALRAHRRSTGRCLLCDLRKRESRVLSRGGWTAYVPRFARWTHEVHLVPEEHIPDLRALRDPLPLASALKSLLRKYDRLFGRPMPLMMAVHQAPRGARWFHLHIEFYPALESRERVKYRGGLETGAGTWTRTRLPEECARDLRRA
ncbi:MAG: galactose-1-phosphate uridylyltransferase [Halobacteria archaeon]